MITHTSLPVTMKTGAFLLLIPLLFVTGGMGYASTEYGGASVEQEEINVSYTLETSIEYPGMPSAITQRTTYDVKGCQQRVDMEGMPPYTITQCDERRQIFIDPTRNTCCVQRLYAGGVTEEAVAVALENVAEGGVVHIETEIADTGERREIFGMEARLITMHTVTEADENACSQAPGRFELEASVWMIDLPLEARPYACMANEELEFNPQPNIPGCEDEITSTLEGDPSLGMGFPAETSMTMTMEGMTSTISTVISDLSFGDVDDSLFDIPEGCNCDFGLAPSSDDAEEEDEAEEEETQNLQVDETDEEIRISLSADVLFDFDRAELQPEAADALGEVLALIQQYPEAAVTVLGHTDSLGSDVYNLRLSERRASSVLNWLLEHDGLDPTRVVVRGQGEAQPVAPNTRPDGSDNPDGRRENRRVEITITKG